MPFQNPGAGAAAPCAGEFDAPAGRPHRHCIMGRAAGGRGGGRPARVAGRGRLVRPGEGEDRRRLSRRRRKRQAARDGEVRVGGIGIAQNGRHRA